MPKKDLPILLTGATGFLGSVIARMLLEAGYTVIAIVRKKSDRSRVQEIKKNSRLIFCTPEKIVACVARHGVECMIHTATCYGRNDEYFSEVIDSNVSFPLRLLELGIEKKIKLFINADTFFNEKLGLKPTERCYVMTKKFFLESAKLAVKDTRVKLINMRIEQMYGPRDSAQKFIPTLIRQLLHNKKIALTEGTQKRDFVFVEDVARAFLAVVQQSRSLNQYEQIGVGTGRTHGIKETVELLKQLAGSRSVLQWGALPYRTNEIMNSVADLSQAKKIKWQAKTPLAEGVEKTIAFYRQKLG